MTAPVQSQGPETLHDWIQYLQNAAAEPRDSPYYQDSRAAVGLALRHIHALNTAAAQAEANPPPPVTGLDKAQDVLRTARTNLLHGLSLGTGEPLAGFFSMLTGQGFGPGAEQYREGLERTQAYAPNVAATSDLLGMLALPTGTVGSGLTAIKAGVPLTIGQGAGLLTRGALAGAVPGAVAGFSAGGEDAGDIPARVQAAERAAALGGLLGILGTGAGIKLTRAHVERAADLAQRGERRALTASRLAESRARLSRQQPPPIPQGATADEAAVARALGLPIEQVKGRVGLRAASVQPTAPRIPHADPLDVPTFLRTRVSVPETPGMLPPTLLSPRAPSAPAGGVIFRNPSKVFDLVGRKYPGRPPQIEAFYYRVPGSEDIANVPASMRGVASQVFRETLDDLLSQGEGQVVITDPSESMNAFLARMVKRGWLRPAGTRPPRYPMDVPQPLFDILPTKQTTTKDL